MSPRQQVPWNTCAVDAGEPGSPAEGRGEEELPSLVPFFSLSMVSALPLGMQKPKQTWGRAEEMCFNSKYRLVIYQCRVIEVISCRF